MKNLFILVSLTLSAFMAEAQSVYPGNNRDGYGGSVGKGSLSISEDANNYYFTLTKGTNDLNDAVVLYIDTRAGGFTTTANFTDEGDGLRKAVSGVQGTDRATLNFPSGFKPDFAVAFDQDFGGVWELVENGSHPYINSVGLSPINTTTAASYTFTLAKADVGIPPGFRFLVTYASETGYRSNEFIGDAGPVANPQNSAYTANAYLIFANPLEIGFSGLKGQLINKSVRLSWNVSDEDAGGRYEVGRSGNGSDFHSIGSISSVKSRSYAYDDNNPLNGNNYYRIEYTDGNGKRTYSKTVSVQAPAQDALKAFVSGNQLKVTLDLEQAGSYKMALINASGQAVIMKDLNYDGAMNSFDITMENTLTSGIYSILVKGKDINLSTQVLIR